MFVEFLQPAAVGFTLRTSNVAMPPEFFFCGVFVPSFSSRQQLENSLSHKLLSHRSNRGIVLFIAFCALSMESLGFSFLGGGTTTKPGQC